MKSQIGIAFSLGFRDLGRLALVEAAAPNLILQTVLPYKLIEFSGLRRDIEYSSAVIESGHGIWTFYVLRIAPLSNRADV
jgi:hypothetical protein